LKALVITHTDSEGPGSLGEFLGSAGVRVRTARLDAGDSLPADPRKLDLVVSMGGPMSVHDEGRHPFLRAEIGFLRAAVQADVPVLGICLGAQLIAKACGAEVMKAPAKEVGWGEVVLTAAGLADPVFRGGPPVLPVFQWHEDTFDVPVGGELLATSPACHHQAFRIRGAVGLQFHVEVTREVLLDWFPHPAGYSPLIGRFDELEQDFARCARTIYANVVAAADARSSARRAS